MKRLIPLIILLLLLSSLNSIALSQPQLNIQLGDSLINFNPSPINIGGRVHIPLTSFFRQIGGRVIYDAPTSTYNVLYENYYLKFDTRNNSIINVAKGESVRLNYASYFNQTYVPIRQVFEFIEHNVSWIGTSRTVLLNSVANYIPVINYNYIVPDSELSNYIGRVEVVGARQFEEQIKYLADNGYRSLTLEDIKDFNQGTSFYEKVVLITFDGGHISNYTYAYPILRKYNMTGILFVETNSVGRTSSYVNWRQLKEMYDSKVMDVQSLTHSMYKFDGGYQMLQARPSEIIKDLRVSKQMIEALVENEAKALAYPFGLYNEAIITYVREAGFEMAFTTKGSNISKRQNIMSLTRNNIHHWMDLNRFIQILENR